MIVVAIIAIIASMAIPKLMSARLSANEAAAISTLRSLTSAEALVALRAAVDTDADGIGEYAYFAELAGTKPLRTSAGGAPAPGVVGTDELKPAVLSIAFGAVNAQSLVSRSGYFYQLWLPGASAGGLTPAIAENPGGGANPGAFPNSDNGENVWCAYAWPMSVHQTGDRAFFVNQQGNMMMFQNRNATPYTGTSKMPAFDEAFVTAGDMASPVRVGVSGGADATLWVPVQ